MGLVINTNTQAINAQRNLTRTSSSLSTSMARLSSGLRITSAKDDAAGLAISEKMKAQIRGLSQAERNANDGISLVQTAEGAMDEISGMLIRMRELAVQSANGTTDSDQKGFLNNEFSQLSDEITRIANSTEFNGISLLNGDSTVSLQIGIGTAAADNQLDVELTDVRATSSHIDVDSENISTATDALSAIDTIDTAITNLSEQRGILGAYQNRLSSTVNNLATTRENLAASNSRIRDVDVASESVEMTKSQILMQAGTAVLAQANGLPSMALALIG
ncbi:MAG: flagellin FliC [Deltaproteobacteria bacterium]|nr:flagellin FliC [Deltaproteobacteria bacterium]MBN2671691.1 flagellin FliC [Deltaproteobacteria bacterium]